MYNSIVTSVNQLIAIIKQCNPPPPLDLDLDLVWVVQKPRGGKK